MAGASVPAGDVPEFAHRKIIRNRQEHIMPSFEIPDGPTTVKLSGSLTDANTPRTGSVVFAVNNKAGDTRSGRLSIQVAGQAKAEWFAIDGEQERKFDPSPASQTVTVKLTVPADVAAGNYPFRLRVVAVNDPDNDFADGPATTAEVAAGVVIKPSRIWLWIVLAVVLLAVIGGVLWFVLKPKPAVPVIEPTSNTSAPESVPTTAKVPNLVGKTLAEAGTLAGDFDLITVAGAADGKAPDTIVSQNPDQGTTQTKQSPLKVTFDPGVTVPDLSNRSLPDAINVINANKLKVATASTRCATTGKDGVIIGQTPAAPQRVASGTPVAIIVRSVPEPVNGRPGSCRPQIFRGQFQIKELSRVIRLQPIQ